MTTRGLVVLAFAAFGGIASASVSPVPDGVELLDAGPRGVRFSVAAPSISFQSPSGAEGMKTFALEGFENTALPGEPWLPVRVVMVAVPPEGAVRVRGTGTLPETTPGVSLAPQPRVERGAEGESPDYVRSRLAYSRPTVVARARLLDVTWMRNQRVARVAVSPADYDPATGMVTLYRRIDVELEVDGASPIGRAAEEPDPFEDVYQHALVNYEQGRSWRRTADARTPVTPVMPGSVQGVGTGSSVFPGRSWVKIAIPHTGFYRVDFGVLRLLDLFSNDTTVPVDSLRLFTWPGYPVLAERDFCDTCDYREVPIGVVDNGDGRLNDNAEGFYFFALGASDWADLYDPARPDTVFVNHPYETLNYYYLTISTSENPVAGPKLRIPVVSGAPTPGGGEITPATFEARAHFENDSPSEYWPDASNYGTTLAWEKWFWRSLGLNSTFSVGFDLPGADTTQAARLRMRLWGLRASCDTCVCPQLDPDAHVTNLALNGQAVGTYRWGRKIDLGGKTPLTIDTPVTGLFQSGNSVRISVPGVVCPHPEDTQGLAWFDFFYPRRFEPSRDVLTFDSPAAAGNYLYRIGPFIGASAPRVFDVTDSYAPFEIVGADTTLEPRGQFLSFETVQNEPRRYRVIQDTSIVNLTAASVFMAPVTSLENLRDRNGAQYVVIYYDGFQEAAELLANWRHTHQGFSIFTVPISALYDQFSGGRTDPAAIRDMLRAAYVRWPVKPIYVTLLGDASYDFKNYLGHAEAGQPGTLLPSYENGFDLSTERQYATDDWLLNVIDRPNQGSGIPDFFGGRIPADDPATALSVVRDKVIAYERSAPFGEYRNRIMLIADDDRQGSLPDPLRWQHVSYTNQLNIFYTPQHLDRKYVYLHTYPSPGQSYTKPAAREDIIQTLHQGVVVFNYIGHGSPFQLSDERVFIDQDVSFLKNADRLPLFIAASCDVGKFNDPVVPSLGELLITHQGGGAIGVVSATEIAFAGQNATLNNTIYSRIFSRAPAGKYHVPISEALVLGKTGSVNSQKYQLLGDAATVLNLPHLWLEVTLHDSIGGPPVTDLKPGTTMLFEGRVLDGQGGPPVGVDGQASILVEDSAPIVQPADCGGVECQDYVYYAGTMFRGDVSVRDGSFQGRFVVPLEARQGNRGRFRAYAEGARTDTVANDDGVGSVRTTIQPGAAVVNDHDGPRITLSFQGGSTVVRPDAVLQAVLFDASGILTTGHSPQNAIIVTVDDNSGTRVDISPTFRYAADSYQSGSATYRLPDLPVGPHHIKVSAADNLAGGLTAAEHRSSATLEFEVQDVPPLEVSRALLFPNPVRSGGSGSGGQFVVDAPGDPVNVLLKIYTVSGRLIRVLKAFGGQGQVQLPWDGLDAEGQKLANGVYLFKVNVNVREADGRSSARQRGDAEGRFVVAGH